MSNPAHFASPPFLAHLIPPCCPPAGLYRLATPTSCHALGERNTDHGVWRITGGMLPGGDRSSVSLLEGVRPLHKLAAWGRAWGLDCQAYRVHVDCCRADCMDDGGYGDEGRCDAHTLRTAQTSNRDQSSDWEVTREPGKHPASSKDGCRSESSGQEILLLTRKPALRPGNPWRQAAEEPHSCPHELREGHRLSQRPPTAQHLAH